MIQHRRSWLFKIAVKLLKYYLLSAFGYGVLCLLLILLGFSQGLGFLLPFCIVFWKVGVTIFCIIAIAVVIESLNS